MISTRHISREISYMINTILTLTTSTILTLMINTILTVMISTIQTLMIIITRTMMISIRSHISIFPKTNINIKIFNNKNMIRTNTTKSKTTNRQVICIIKMIKEQILAMIKAIMINPQWTNASMNIIMTSLGKL